MHMPVILKISGNKIVIGIGNDQWPRWNCTADGGGKEQVLIVDYAIVVVIEISEVLNENDAPRLEDTKEKRIINALNLAAKSQVVAPPCPVHGIIPLQPILRSLLRHPEGGTISQAGKIQFWSRTHRIRGVNEVVDAETQLIQQRRTEYARPGPQKTLEVALSVLPLRC